MITYDNLNFQEIKIEAIKLNNIILLNAKHIAKCLDIKDINSSIRKLSHGSVFKIKNADFQNKTFRKLNNFGENFLDSNAVLELTLRSRKCVAKKFFIWFVYEALPIFCNEEQRIIDIYFPHIDEPTKLLIKSQLKCCRENVVIQRYNNEKIKDLKAENHKYKKMYEQLTQKLSVVKSQLENNTKHNARGAGRKPSPERLKSIEQVKVLLDSGCSDQDIMTQLGISRATFYRYKKEIKK